MVRGTGCRQRLSVGRPMRVYVGSLPADHPTIDVLAWFGRLDGADDASRVVGAADGGLLEIEPKGFFPMIVDQLDPVLPSLETASILMKFLPIVVGLLALVPLATAPLALAWNRHR